jgi:sulfur carrier protein
MKATLIFRENVYEVEAGMSIRSALEKIGISLQSVLPTKDGELVNEEEILKPGDKIKLVAIMSGG